jgi:hypothetical protein
MLCDTDRENFLDRINRILPNGAMECQSNGKGSNWNISLILGANWINPAILSK